MAGTAQLKPPPADIKRRALEIDWVHPAALCRVSRYHSGEPHFGRTGSCRFDDAQADIGKRFGTCYLGVDLTVALAESVLHDREPDIHGFSVPTTEVTSRFALSFKATKRGAKLKLAKMYGTALLRLGGNGELSGTSDYALPQAWAAALVDHPAMIDGFLYMSRRINDTLAVVLFERSPAAKPTLRMDKFAPLAHHRDYLSAVLALGITVA